MPTLLALYSPAPQSGKSTFANIAVHEFGFKCISLAKPLKDMLGLMLGSVYGPHEVHDMLYGSLKAHKLLDFGELTPRELCESLGTRWGRNQVRKDLWIYLWRAQVTKALEAGYNVGCDDMRFPNEIEAVYQLKGTPIKIIRPGATVPLGISTEGMLEDEMFSLEIVNDASLVGYEQSVRDVIHDSLGWARMHKAKV